MSSVIKMMIVDDEPLIIRSLKVALPWSDYGIEIVGEARNGQLAIELFKEVQPDIVLSDIRMPSVDGMELMKSLFSMRPELIFILISGYGEFEYARIGLREGAFDYILKPIDHEELEKTIIKAIRQINQWRKKQSETDDLYMSLQHLSMLARERMYTQLLEGSYELTEVNKYLEKSELDRRYFMLLVSIDAYVQFQQRWSLEEQKLWLYIINNILEEIGERDGALAVFPYHQGEWVVLFSAHQAKQATTLAELIINDLKTYGKQNTSIGISEIFEGLSSLNRCYQSAKRALIGRFYQGGLKVFNDDHIDATNDQLYETLRAEEKQILQDVKVLDTVKVISSVTKWGEILKASNVPQQQAEVLVLELLGIIRRQLALVQPSISKSEDTIYQELQLISTIDELLSLIDNKVSNWIQEASTEAWSKDLTKASIEKVKLFIEEAYQKNIGIDAAVEIADMSVSHFCYIFKQETSMTFLEYLTKIRMEKACNMLQNTDIKVFQVAQLVGYHDAKYFSQVFRKIMGCKPSDFREQKKLQQL